MSKNRTNPRKIPRTEEDCRREYRRGFIEATRTMEAVVLRVGIDKHSDTLDIDRFWQDMTDYMVQVSKGKLTLADLRDTLKQEDKIKLLAGPSKAIARGGE